MFTTAMREKWKLVYIDLFAGPGKCIVRGSQEEIDGSPLIALKSKYRFAKYIFVDNNPKAIEALRKRVEALELGVDAKYHVEDCNNAIDDVREELTSETLCLAFIDPTGLQIKWNSIKRLVAGRKIDMLFSFMYHMGIKRNIRKSLNVRDSAIDYFLPPGFNWREFYEKSGRNPRATAMAILGHYIRGLNSLGYIEMSIQNDLIPITNTRGVYLYFLLFVSKHQLGVKFWRENIKKEFSQLRLL